MAAKKLGSKRYSPTKVTRSVLSATEYGRFEPVASYDDATVRDNGENGILGAPQVMLRAYSNDPEFYGDEDYLSGNGIGVVTSGRDKGWVMDCDSDVALERIMMTVLSTHNHGHSQIEYTGIVNFSKETTWGNGTREIKEWDGFGDNRTVRIERWVINLHPDYDLKENQDL